MKADPIIMHDCADLSTSHLGIKMTGADTASKSEPMKHASEQKNTVPGREHHVEAAPLECPKLQNAGKGSQTNSGTPSGSTPEAQPRMKAHGTRGQH